MTERKYETVLVFAETTAQEQIDEVVERLRELVTKAGANEVEVVPWGKRRLAYEIAKNRYGHYVFFRFTAPTTVPAELERQLRITPELIRFQTFLFEGEPGEKDLHFRNVAVLAQYITERGKIRPARATRMSAKKQRRLAREIKRARMLGLLPFTTLGA